MKLLVFSKQVVLHKASILRENRRINILSVKLVK